MSGRTFVVTVSESPQRVVVEDVWSRRRIVAADLEAVGREIARMLEPPPDDRDGLDGGKTDGAEVDR